MPEYDNTGGPLGIEQTVPKSRFPTADSVHRAVGVLVDAHKERQRKTAAWQGMFDGNPPWDPAKLRRAAQANRSNFNTMEAKAILSTALTTFYDLFSATEHFATVRTKEGEGEEREVWSRIITEEFHAMLDDWPDFDNRVQRMLKDLVAFNQGFLVWDGEKDWQFKIINHFQLLTPTSTEMDLGKLEWFAIRQRHPAHELYAKIRDKDVGRMAGWNVDSVWKSLRAAAPRQFEDNEQWHLIQREYASHDLLVSAESRTIQTAMVFVREFNGKWSQLIIDEDRQADNEFLFERVGDIESVNHVLATFFYELLDGQWNATGGLGKDIWGFMRHKDRLTNVLVDGAYLGSGLMVKAMTGRALQETPVVQIGALTILNPNFEVQQARLAGDLNQSVALLRELDGKVAMNTGVYRGRPEQPTGNPRTAEEVRLQFQHAAVLTNSAVNRFYRQLDFAYREMYRRATQEDLIKDSCEGVDAALAFMKRCKDRGVPLKALRNVHKVRAMRAIGNGSPGARQQALMSMSPFVSSFPESGKLAYLRDVVAAFGDQTLVERYMPLGGVDNSTARQEWEAQSENNDLAEGAPQRVTIEHNHVIHLQSHLMAMGMAAKSLEAGGNPEQVLVALEAFGPHVALHLQKARGDALRKDQLAAFEQEWRRLSKIATELQRFVAEKAAMQQEAQQKQTGMTPEMQIATAELEHKMRLDTAEVQERNRLRSEKARHDAALDEAKTMAAIERENRLAEAKARGANDRES